MNEDELDIEISKTLNRLVELSEKRDLVCMAFVSSADDMKFVEKWPRWSAVQMTPNGHTVLPRNFREGMDPVKTVNIGAKIVNAMNSVFKDLSKSLNHCINTHKVIIANNIAPQSMLDEVKTPVVKDKPKYPH